MEFQVLQENLANSLNLASRFTSAKSQLPVLGNILLSCKKTNLLVSATNLEVSISISIGAKVSSEGDITIPGRTITELIGNLSPGALDFESEREQLKISGPNFSSSILGMNSSDFPSVPQSINKNLAIPLPKEEFVEALMQTLYAVSIDPTRPILTGLLFVFNKHELILVGTDGFRLSQKRITLAKEVKAQKLILPKPALSEISRFVESEEDIYFSFSEKENQAIFAVGDTVISTRVLQGDFPDFEKIIPKNPTAKITLDKEEFLKTVKLSGVFARDSANIVKISIKENFVEVSAESAQAGNQKTKIDAKIEGTKELEIAFNYRFLEEFLHSVKGEEVKIELSDASTAGVFADTKDTNFLHLVMPVQIQD